MQVKRRYVPRAERTFPTLSLVEGAKAYAQLRSEVTEAGILDRSYGYYFMNGLFAIGGFFLTILFIYFASPLWLVGILGLLFTFFMVQFGGLFHDAGHRAIFKSIKFNDLVGHICGFLFVDSIDAWMRVHNKHHASTNEMDEDPDLEIPLHSFTTSRFMQEIGWAKVFKRYQAYTFYPLRILVFVTRRLAALSYFIETFTIRNSWKLLLFAVGIFIWFLLPFILFDFAKALVAVLSINISGGFYLSNIFAPNHKGMPQLKKGQKISFLEHQIITSRNVKGGYLTELFFVGLNYQIEHHLFTNCPRNKLKLVTPFVKKICKKYGFEYTEVGIVETNKIILRELNDVALAA
jgi:fatty acid desaturase